jgi:Chromo (CHRromatin Organisation MOdifier) domain
MRRSTRLFNKDAATPAKGESAAGSSGRRRKKTRPEPVVVNGVEEYQVERILDQRKHRNSLEFLVKWKNYPMSEASWEPLANVEGNEALIEFLKANETSKASNGSKTA